MQRFRIVRAETIYGVSVEMQQAESRKIRGTALNLVLGAALMGISVAGCSPHPRIQGNVVDPQLLEQVKPGALNKDQVQTLIGTPSSVSTFDQNTWYYISKETERWAFFEPTVLNQQVVVVEFDDKNVVKAVHKYGEEDGKDVQVVSRTTPTRGKSLGVFDQLWNTLLKQFANGNGADATTRDPILRRTRFSRSQGEPN